jgi:hypothetical protein
MVFFLVVISGVVTVQFPALYLQSCTHAKHAKQKCISIGLYNCFLQFLKRQKFIGYQRIACQAHHTLHYH